VPQTFGNLVQQKIYHLSKELTAMEYGIDIGHNCSPDTGARGIRVEDVMTMEVGTRVISKLKSQGHQVVECKPKSASTVGIPYCKDAI
jgi:N-acetylmuramoyl-L-alanine amidase